jgi:hypothetical protein
VLAYTVAPSIKADPPMKKLALALVAVLSLLSIASCTTAPPPPMMTKG